MLNDTHKWHTIIPLTKWQRNLLIFSSVALISYLIVGLFIIPVIIEWLINDFVETDLDRPLEIGSIGFNPLTFALSINDFYLFEPDSNVFINWRKFTADPNVLSLFNGVVEIDTMALHDVEINIIRNQDCTFNLEDPVNHFLTLVLDSLGIGSEWGLCVNRFGIHSATAAFKDDLLAPYFIYDVENVYFQLNDLHLFSQDTSTWQLNLHVGNGGMIEASGSLLTDRITSDLSFRVKDLALISFQPLLSKFVHLQIDSGTVDTYGNMHVELDSLYYPHVLNIAGTISNHNLSLYDLLKDETFLSWDSLTTTGITADINPLQANIADIKVRNLFARLAIAQDKSINAVDVFQPLIQLIETDSTMLEILTPENIQLNIDRITIIDGKSSFSDLSLPLPFASRIHSLNGDLRNISWDNPQGARLNLEGSVDQYGYVSVRGTFDPFYPLARTDLDVVFDNIELHNLTPYSAKFAGYKLRIIPSVITTWRQWKSDHPQGLVLSTDTGFHRDYSYDPYEGYHQGSVTGVLSQQIDPRLQEKESVIGIDLGGIKKAYPLSKLKTRRPIEEVIEGKKILIYGGPSNTAYITDEEGNILSGIVAYWFAWSVFNPDTLIFEQEQ